MLAQKKRGPAPTGKGQQVVVRIQPSPLAALDAYIDQQPNPKPSRPEMIRKILEDRLVHEGLIEAGPQVGTRP